MTALTAQSTVGEWLESPNGGPLIHGFLEQAGVPAEDLGPARRLPLQQLVALSDGKLPQAVVDDLVREANGGTLPEEPADGPWREQVTPGRFAGRTIIVTGAASGIGRAVASRLARESARLVAVDLAADGLNELAAALPQSDIVTVAGDITRQDSVEEIVAAAGEHIDGLANVAGINDDFSPLHETDDATWERVMGVNVTGTFRLTRAVLPAMLCAGRGAVVNVASEAALRGSASGNAYTTSKHAVVGMTRSAAFMYGPRGIRINAVAPGGVATGIPFPPHVSEAGSARLRPFQEQIPSIATAQQIAASITFLLSEDGANLNGVILPSDGGWSVQ